jgi:alpha-mannosidase
MWYTRASQENKDRLKMLIENGQFEITTGGWTSTDEACPNYEDLINNMMIGHQFLENEFGFTPRVGWNLESFGHSNTNARLFA